MRKVFQSRLVHLVFVLALSVSVLISGCAAPAAPTPTAAPKAPAASTPAVQAPAATSAPAATPAQPAAAKRLVIGFTASQTGAQNLPSKKQIEGLQLWLDDVTKAGGIKLKNGTALMPEMKFYDDKVDFLISPYSSGLAKAAAVVSE